MSGISERAWWWIRVLWVLAGATFTVTRLVGSGADNTAIAGLVFTFSVFVLPLIKALKLPGGTELQLQAENLKKVEVKEDELNLDLANVLVRYTSSIAATDAVLAGASTPASKYAFALLKAVSAIEDSLRWFAVNEPVRVLVYTLREQNRVQALVFVTGNVDSDEAFVLARLGFPVTEKDVDPLALCWRQRKVIHRSEATADDRPPVAAGHGRYRGIMTVPIRQVDDMWGVLVVEREKPELFNTLAENVGRALGNVVSAALAHPALTAS
jgi:GAF domain-containing protein